MKRLEQSINQLSQAEQLPPELLYKKIAARHCAEKADCILEAGLSVVLGCVGFLTAGIPGALLLASAPAMMGALKTLDGWEGLQDVESGDQWEKQLPPRELKRYQREVKAQLSLPPAPGGSTLPSAPPAPGAPSPMAPPQSAQWNQAQWDLWNRITRDCPELRYALFAKVVVISGPQQTGKSTLASAIAYCRFFLFLHPSIAVSPHVDGRKMFDGLVVGAGGDFDEIGRWYENLKDTLGKSRDRTTLIIDELTQYQGEHKPLGQAIVMTALSESDKHNYSPILLNHASTVSAGFADIKGCKSLIEESAVQITRKYETTPWGATTRSPQVTIAVPGAAPVTTTIPDWFRLEELRAAPPQDSVAALEKAFHGPSAQSPFDALPTEDEILANLPQELRLIAEFAKKKGDWVKARDVLGGIRHFRDGGFKSEQIRGYFMQLTQLGVGTADGQGDSLTYRFS